MNTTRTFLTAALAGAAAAASAATIAIDGVAQRWPWNNKVDITYTVSGGQDVAAGVYARIVFTATIDGKEHVIDGVHDVGASASDGTHVVTWTPPAALRVKSLGCAMTARLLSADAPSGDDYMIVDLGTGAMTYEGLLATQDASNARYNTATYKTDRLVLRKVPAGGLYPAGGTTWATAKDYYIGVFPVTQGQYAKVYGSNPSGRTSVIAGNETAHRPVEMVSWDDLRLATTAPTSSIPAVASADAGTFFQRLNCRTGLYFDLPTEVMFEIAERAGTTTTYFWGDEQDTDYVVCQENSGGSTVAVGSRLPNAWGLYDTAGNVWELCLDDVVGGNLTARTDAFTPAWASGAYRRRRGGGSWGDVSSYEAFSASYRGSRTSSQRSDLMGFRVSRIAD